MLDGNLEICIPCLKKYALCGKETPHTRENMMREEGKTLCGLGGDQISLQPDDVNPSSIRDTN